MPYGLALKADWFLAGKPPPLIDDDEVWTFTSLLSKCNSLNVDSIFGNFFHVSQNRRKRRKNERISPFGPVVTRPMIHLITSRRFQPFSLILTSSLMLFLIVRSALHLLPPFPFGVPNSRIMIAPRYQTSSGLHPRNRLLWAPPYSSCKTGFSRV